MTLLNTSLRGDSLRHALRQCSIGLVLFDAASSAVLAPLCPLVAAAGAAATMAAAESSAMGAAATASAATAAPPSPEPVEPPSPLSRQISAVRDWLVNAEGIATAASPLVEAAPAAEPPPAAAAAAATDLPAAVDAEAAANADDVLDTAAAATADGRGPVAAEGEAPPLRFVCLDAAATPPFASPLELRAPASSCAARARAVRAGCRSSDTLLHIFTSGTTGLPKAARLNHIRFFSAIVLPHLFDLKASDRLYCCLPMCHTAAVGSLSICWWLGIPLILAPRFSASTFWSECAEHGATVVQYVGELCRFLLATPPSPHDRGHRVRLALGNGLRPDVWPRFKARFGIERVAELYASTEGNANLANTEGKEGAVGFISPLLAPVYPVRLVRLADSSAAGGEIARGPNGLALLCGGGEAGELLGLVNQRDAARNFAGYTDAAATRRKLVRDVLKRGDCWFRTGDLMRTDGEGFVYFVDRLGDTFRYKGENVSTAEVAAAIGAIGPLRLAQCVVYGVRLPQVRTARRSAWHMHWMRSARALHACMCPCPCLCLCLCLRLCLCPRPCRTRSTRARPRRSWRAPARPAAASRPPGARHIGLQPQSRRVAASAT